MEARRYAAALLGLLFILQGCGGASRVETPSPTPAPFTLPSDFCVVRDIGTIECLSIEDLERAAEQSDQVTTVIGFIEDLVIKLGLSIADLSSGVLFLCGDDSVGLIGAAEAPAIEDRISEDLAVDMAAACYKSAAARLASDLDAFGYAGTGGTSTADAVDLIDQRIKSCEQSAIDNAPTLGPVAIIAVKAAFAVATALVIYVGKKAIDKAFDDDPPPPKPPDPPSPDPGPGSPDPDPPDPEDPDPPDPEDPEPPPTIPVDEEAANSCAGRAAWWELTKYVCDQTQWTAYECVALLQTAAGGSPMRCVNPGLIIPNPEGDYVCGRVLTDEELAAARAEFCNRLPVQGDEQACLSPEELERAPPLLADTCNNPHALVPEEACLPQELDFPGLQTGAPQPTFNPPVEPLQEGDLLPPIHLELRPAG